MVEFCENLLVRHAGLLQLHLVVADALLVGLVHASRGNALEFCTVLHPQLIVFLLFGRHNLLQVCDHVVVDLDKGFVAFNCTRKVLIGTLLLEMLNLGPQSVGNLLRCSQRVQGLGQTKLL